MMPAREVAERIVLVVVVEIAMAPVVAAARDQVLPVVPIVVAAMAVLLVVAAMAVATHVVLAARTVAPGLA